MEVRTCKSCGRMFNCIGRTPLCPACADEMEKKFQQVKEYVWEHRSATLQDISENNDVSVKQLRQWVREERLTFSDKSPVGGAGVREVRSDDQDGPLLREVQEQAKQ